MRQSGSTPAAHGRISRQGSAAARYALGEAAWSVVRQPGPLHAFYRRVGARRGHQVAIVAVARKLGCLFWCLLTREEDYAYAQPSLTRKKLRRLELRAGAERGKVAPGLWAANAAMRDAERELARQAEAAYKSTVADWRAQEGKRGAGATPGRVSWAVKQPSSAAGQSPWPCSLARRQDRRPRPLSQIGGSASRSDLTFIRRAKEKRPLALLELQLRRLSAGVTPPVGV